MDAHRFRGHEDGEPAPGVDVAVLLANERTLLAWLRTALTLLADGVALIQLTGRHRVLSLIGIALFMLGSLTSVAGYLRYRAVRRAVLDGRVPPSGHGPALLTAGIVTVTAAIAVTYVVRKFP
ncbi:DUF202 domain-containing protein [Dactylosporangium aurantiacum]|uniref:DUF202 domain-containing protein n=1 Tax=Dactylosporangium aurantiacum TaxID=35754 RepID=A0A9Q9ISH8_9ACTN|nr:DUF202 domain-containing protein [Dactylosporangium aurantiacum]MDG6110317.1 DUF202 domain-containing protein [Dactylosporangium aurantiacum]UWZ58564.1 DUF202 domain-containing protein [Dactylosporangium aurantiacum]